MEYVLPLLGIAGANLLAAMTPGPAVFLVTRTAMGGSRRAAFAAAAGVILGAVAWAAAAVFGLALVFAQIVWLYRGVELLGGLYLIYLAVMSWRDAATPVDDGSSAAAADSPWRTFAKSLTLQLSNPKVVVFFGSIFVALLPANAPTWVWVATLLIVLFNETAWYTTLVLSFSAGPMRRIYGRAKPWLDRAVAGVLGALGAKLILDSR